MTTQREFDLFYRKIIRRSWLALVISGLASIAVMAAGLFAIAFTLLWLTDIAASPAQIVGLLLFLYFPTRVVCWAAGAIIFPIQMWLGRARP